MTVFKRLNPASLAVACRVCGDWRRVACSDALWLPVYLRRMPNVELGQVCSIPPSYAPPPLGENRLRPAQPFVCA